MIVHEIKTINNILMSDFLYVIFSEVEILLWGNNQNISCSILTWLGKTNTFFTFSRKLEAMSDN